MSQQQLVPQEQQQDVALAAPAAPRVAPMPTYPVITNVAQFCNHGFTIIDKENCVPNSTFKFKQFKLVLEGGFIDMSFVKHIETKFKRVMPVHKFKILLDDKSSMLLSYIEDQASNAVNAAGCAYNRHYDRAKGNTLFIEKIGIPLTKFNGAQVQGIEQLQKMCLSNALYMRRVKILLHVKEGQVWTQKNTNNPTAKVVVELEQMAVAVEPYSSETFLI